MRWTILLCGLTGCFYTESINQRPSIDIMRESSGPVHRKDFLTFTALSSDPENQPIDLSWTAFLCTDASAAGGCDAMPFQTGTLEKFAFMVPPMRLELGPVQSVLVGLSAKDAYGAAARPDQHAIVTVDDRPPTLELAAASHYGFVEGVDVELFGKVTDPDDGPGLVGPLAWEVFTPSVDATYTQTIDRPASTDQLSRTETLTLRAPTGAGQWTIRATAMDELGLTDVQMTTIAIKPDSDPCLEQWSPIAPLDGTTALPMSERTLFQVPVVVDDLDVYPAVPSDPVLGTTRFAWSILAPGAASFAALAATGNSVELDPATYAPNDVVELRVQIYDRRNVPITCDPTLLTCSTSSSASCIQRLTWRVVVQ